MATATHSRQGRPLKLAQVARTTDTGEQVTYGQEFIARIRLGLPHDQAASGSGVPRMTVLRARTNGTAARAKADAGQPLTDDDRFLIAFCDSLERAEAEAEESRLAIIERAAQGGYTTTTTYVTERLVDGVLKEVERRTVTKVEAGQWTAAAWWLERRLPQRYARRVELSGPEGGPIPVEDRANALGDAMTAYLAGVAEMSDTEQADAG